MANSAPIILNDQIIGQISVDGSAVCGEGGPNNPQLVVPLQVQLDNQPEEATLAIGQLRALLATEPSIQPSTAICPPVCEDLMGTNPAFRGHVHGRGVLSRAVAGLEEVLAERRPPCDPY